MRSRDCARVLRNLEIGTQSQDSENAQRNFEITQIPRLRGTDTCGKLPCTLALFAVLDPVHPHTIKPFLPSFLSWHQSHKKRYHALSRFLVLQVMETWVGPRYEAMVVVNKLLCFQHSSKSGQQRMAETVPKTCHDRTHLTSHRF